MCPEGFHGRNCHLKVGPCHQRRSVHPLAPVNSYTRLLFRCSSPASCCVSRSPCRNGALCEDANGFAAELTCQCLAGFTGPHCETNVDDCQVQPCANGATCLDGVNHFSCLCPAGFSGRFCSINLDDCASQPCLNGGRCLDRARGFHCLCQPGYTGITCEMLLRATQRWEGEEGGTRLHLTTGGKRSSTPRSGNDSRHSDRLLKVTVSERAAAGLSEDQLTVLLVLAGMTLGMVVLTAALILQGRCQNCVRSPWLLISSSTQRRQKRDLQSCQEEPECGITFLNAAEPKKKKVNAEVV